MDFLTAFGLFADTAMVVCHALEQRSASSSLRSRDRAALGPCMGFSKGHGLSGWSRPYGRWWLFVSGTTLDVLGCPVKTFGERADRAIATSGRAKGNCAWMRQKLRSSRVYRAKLHQRP
jgi:hypothetical protein